MPDIPEDFDPFGDVDKAGESGEELRKLLVREAFSVLRCIAAFDGAPPAVRERAARTMLEAAGVLGRERVPVGRSGAAGAPGELTPAEISAEIARLSAAK